MTKQETIDYYKQILQASVNGLIAEGWKNTGGNDVWRILHDKDDNCIKIFLNDYKFPTFIVTRLS